MASGRSKYTIEILDISGQVIAEFSGLASGRSFTLIRNRAGFASWSIDYDTLEKIGHVINTNPRNVLGIAQHEIRIKRYDKVLFGGQIMFYSGILGESRFVLLRAVGWLDLLSFRHTNALQPYEDTDAGEIAWDLINTTQMKTNGNFGITQGQIQASVNRDRTYEYHNIKDALIQLSEVINGFDFEITPQKVFNVYYPQQGVRRDSFAFEYPGNVKSMDIGVDASRLANVAIVRGLGIGEAQPIEVRQDTVFQSAYKIREQIADYPTVSETSTLQGHGDEILRTQQKPIRTITLTIDGNQQPSIGSYGLGDRVKVKVNNSLLFNDIDAFYRIDEITVLIDENDSEDISIRLSEESST